MPDVPLAQFGERFNRRQRPERVEPLVEVALHAVLQNDGAIGILTLRAFNSSALFHSRRLLLESLLTTLGMSDGSTMTAPCCLRTLIASAITLAWAGFRPPRGSFT